MGNQYSAKVEISPLVSPGTYGDAVDVTDLIDASGISEFRQAIDSEDYTFGLFRFGDIQVTGLNRNGIFNDNADYRSMFQYARDKAKINVQFIIETVEREEQCVTSYSDSTALSFVGLINDEATRLNFQDETIDFIAITFDSVFLNAIISQGQVKDGSSAKDVLFIILNNPIITSVLNIDIGNINPDYDFTIDDGSVFDNLTVFEALKKLLPASNSILLIDSSENVIIKGREYDGTISTLELFGEFDINGRNNILRIENMNNGFHRMFNSIRINDLFEKNDAGFANEFGFRQIDFDFEFVTDSSTLETLANNLLDTFKSPKEELEVIIPMDIGQSVQLLQRVTIDNPLRYEALEGKFLPVVGDAVWEDSDTPYPNQSGSFEIHPDKLWKVIEINQDLLNFETKLKLSLKLTLNGRQLEYAKYKAFAENDEGLKDTLFFEFGKNICEATGYPKDIRILMAACSGAFAFVKGVDWQNILNEIT